MMNQVSSPTQQKDWRKASTQAWRFLLMNRHKPVLYYEDVAAYVGTNPRNVHRALAYILEFCERHHLPPLTGLVVSKTVHRHQHQSRPGGGFRIRHAEHHYYPESVGFPLLYQQALEGIKQAEWERIAYQPKHCDYLALKRYLHAQKQQKTVPTPKGCLQQFVRRATKKRHAILS